LGRGQQDHPELNQSHRLFLFSYYARGMNFKDMAMLKWKDIYNGRINYTREKTGKFFTMRVSENLQAIISEFKDEKSEFVFPILNDLHQSPEQIKNRVKKQLKKFNNDLKEIADILGIDAKITSYVARHTFATTLKKNNASISKISEALGHADVNVTNAYLKRFEDDELDELDILL
jgi:integrase